MSLKGQDFIDLRHLTASDLDNLIALAAKIKAGDIDVSDALSGKTFGLLFSIASTRTRLSFQVAVRQMGGHAEYLNADQLQLVNHESLTDTGQVMSRFLDGIIVRMYNMKNYGEGRSALQTLADNASIPVLNALDDKDHPCQVIADLLTMREKFGPGFKKKKLVFSWGYTERQKSLGVPHSMMVAGSLLGMNMVFAYPEGFDLDEEYIRFTQKMAAESKASISFTNDLMEATEGADVIYVKSWKAINMSVEDDLAARRRVQDDWRISNKHFERANKDAIYMDCLPVIRGEQTLAEVVDGPRSVIYDEAENRLHAQKAILHSIYAPVPVHQPSLTNY
ncbi:ornithine carbamoyltransferase [Chitinophaga qingshengii]|uniref:Ornithine carbamoyltransferase n=1 Tax=Chitinophaga qingshengii TaxID=1569794 RepID=A0ABR7TFW5_9BACT|nr:ornithine carbamoyltransferase [Chitinophaga qingshengii]MBC9929286.1 ornithine carbamoyltransferase [Chitinophaga qingshengii]